MIFKFVFGDSGVDLVVEQVEESEVFGWFEGLDNRISTFVG